MLLALLPHIPQPAATGASETYRVVSRGYGPVGKVAYRRPTFGWAVAPTGGARVTKASLRINSVEIPAEYDAQRGELSYTPAECLKPGSYSVEVALRVNNAVTFRKAWTTEIPSDAKAALPAPTKAQLAIFAELNSLRDEMKLPRYTLDPILSAAAESHADYMSRNNALGHFETPGLSGFLGEDPITRARALGFSGSTWEALGFQGSGSGCPLLTVFEAPYHRIPFMHPSAARVGIGVSPRGTVVDGESAAGEGVVASPGAGASDVRRSWTNCENPDPLRRFPDLGRTVGYPIVFASFGGEGKLQVSSARLLAGEKVVKTVLNTPENDDHLNDSAMLIPAEPLAPKTAYTVEFSARMDGKDVSRRWTFTTGA